MKILLMFMAVIVLAGCVGSQGVRRINLVHFPSGERVNMVYFDGYNYDYDTMAKINHLFRDRETGEVYEIDPKLIDIISEVLSALALPADTQVALTSGFRSPGRNAELADKNKNVARESLHTKGKAADIRIGGVSGKAVAAIAGTIQGGGVAYYAKSNHIHVDTGAVRTWKAR